MFAVATMPVVHYVDRPTRTTAQECIDAPVVAMNDCDGISLQNHYLVSEGDFSQGEGKQLKR